MNICRRLLASVFLYAAGSGVFAGSEETKNDPNAIELANYLFTVTDVILDHDLSPPTRQEMIFHCLRKLFSTTIKQPPRTLSREVSSITNPSGLAALLQRHLSADRLAKLDSVPGRLLDGLKAPFVPTGEFRGATYVDPKETKVARQLSENRYVGIGIALGMTQSKDNRTSRPRVMKVLGKGPAFHAGLRDRDVIEEIDGRDTRNQPLTEIIQWLRGSQGSKVELIARQSPAESARTMTIVRDVVPIQSAVGHSENGPGEHVYQIPEVPDLAFIRINQITGATLNELQNLEPRLAELGIRGVILDLRHARSSRDNNIHHAVMLADGLLPGGDMGTVYNAEFSRRLAAGPDAVFRGLPVAVLLGASTNPGASWIAALLQDNRRARLIGQPSSGNTRVTTAVEIPNYGGSLLLSTSRFERPQKERAATGASDSRSPRRGPKAKPGVVPDQLIEPRQPRMSSPSVPSSQRGPLEAAEVKAAIRHLRDELR